MLSRSLTATYGYTPQAKRMNEFVLRYVDGHDSNIVLVSPASELSLFT